MARVRRWMIGASAALVGLAGAAAAETRIALLIGNQDYPSSVGRLSRPHQDVRVLAAALGDVGFKVATALDADRDQIDSALDRFEKSIAAASDDTVIAFFYYAGHGASTTDDGRRRNYLMPARTEVTTTPQLIRRGVALDTVIRALGATEAHAVFVVSDACRNDLVSSFARGGESRGFGAVASRPGMFIANSTFPGETAPDDGVFADALAESLRLPGAYASRAFELAFRRVAATRSAYQLPTVANALSEDFCFNGCPETRVSLQDLSQRLAGQLKEYGDESVTAAEADDGGERLYGLGEAYYLGALGKAKDYSAAGRHYRAACERGHARACNALGYLFDHGEGAEPNRTEAARLYKLACDGGEARGCANLGILYRFGSGVQRDHASAERYFRAAIRLEPAFEVPYVELEAMGLEP